MKKLLFFAVVISGCSANYTPTEQSLAVRKETKTMLQSKVERMAGRQTNDLTYYFVLNQNKTFSAIIDIHSSKQYEFCAGTFQDNNDTLTLNYYKNYKSNFFSDRAVIDNTNNEINFIGEDSAKNTKLKFLAQLQ